METLRIGNRGYKVELLQRLLNRAAARGGGRVTALAVDGSFGPRTESAVRVFQAGFRSLKVDGVAGPQTWSALGLRYDVEHPAVRLLGQPSTMSCWSAAASMIVGNLSVGSGGAALTAGGGLAPTLANLETFGRSLGWHTPNHSLGIVELCNTLQRTPLWAAGTGAGFAHAVVLSGVYGDGDPSGAGTLFRVHDPWPPGRGRIYGSFADPPTVFGNDGVTRLPLSLQCLLIPR